LLPDLLGFYIQRLAVYHMVIYIFIKLIDYAGKYTVFHFGFAFIPLKLFRAISRRSVLVTQRLKY
jgi:hypothetical protein